VIEPAALSDSRLVRGVIAGFFVLGLRIVLWAVRGRDDIVLRAEDPGPTRYRSDVLWCNPNPVQRPLPLSRKLLPQVGRYQLKPRAGEDR
jgi:hypothetical protein